MVKQKRRSDCPINFALEIFGDRWTLLVVRDMMFKRKHYYSEFLQSEEGIATNILADRLLMLEDSGLITKKADPLHGSKFIYKLTNKGIDLVPVLADMIGWSARHDPLSAADKEFIHQLNTDRDGLIKTTSDLLAKEIVE